MVMAYDFHWSASARAGGVAPTTAARSPRRRRHARSPRAGAGRQAHLGVPTTAGPGTRRATPRKRRCAHRRRLSHSATTDRRRGTRRRRVLAERLGADGIPPARCRVRFWDEGSGGVRQGYYDDPASLTDQVRPGPCQRPCRHRIWHSHGTPRPDLWNVSGSLLLKISTQRWRGPLRHGRAREPRALRPRRRRAYIATRQLPDAWRPARSRPMPRPVLSRHRLAARRDHEELVRLRPQSIFVLAVRGGQRRRARDAARLRHDRTVGASGDLTAMRPPPLRVP